MTSNASVRRYFMDIFVLKFQQLACWQRIEPEIATLCAALTEPHTNDQKDKLLGQLESIKKYLLDQSLDAKDLVFLDEEIERIRYMKQITLYAEKDDYVDPKVISKYAQIGYGTEGVIAISQPFSYTQLGKLVNGVYREEGLIKFFISNETITYGKVTAEVFENPVPVAVARLMHSKKLGKDGEPLVKHIFLYGQKAEQSKYVLIKEITVPLRIYRFISDTNEEMFLLTTESISIGDYILSGVSTMTDDFRPLGEGSVKLPAKATLFFAQEIRNRIIKYADHGELRKKLAELEITPPRLFEFPFTVHVKKTGKSYIMKHPAWFKWLIWAWLCHARKGLLNEYPLHIMIIGPKNSGKSVLMSGLHRRSKESREVFSGASSTLKFLIPSFKYNPARLGYMAESNRFAFCDEFLRCIFNTKTSSDDGGREEQVASMNDLLEHQKREFGSGVAKLNVNMTARVLAATNPVRDIHCMDDLVRKMDESFMSRWLVYFQHEDGEHVKMVRASNDSELIEYSGRILEDADWVGLLDYLWTFHASYDLKRVLEVYESVKPVLSDTLLHHYDARHKHHIECILDGLIKARCLMERDMTFKAKEEDYAQLKEVWVNIIRSWVDVEMVKRAPVDQRYYYMPETAQYLYNKIKSAGRAINREELQRLVGAELTGTEFIQAFMVLRENELIYEDDGHVRPHYMKLRQEYEQEQQQRLSD